MTKKNEAPAAVAAATHTRQAERFEVVMLDWPVEYDGVTYDRITVSRMTVTQLANYMDTINKENGLSALPMFDVPRAVVDALDADDGGKLDEVAFRFLPQGLRTTAASNPSTGENISASPPPA
jgi:hypothetical protein